MKKRGNYVVDQFRIDRRHHKEFDFWGGHEFTQYKFIDDLISQSMNGV